MAENDVGGIGVKFTAEAAQLQQELQKLEQRLKQFDSAHGQKKIRLQAELVMPGNRALQDFRRDLEKGFGSQGSAGRVKARIELIPPTASEIKALTGKIGDVKVKVVGNFEWGTKPPKTVTVKVVEEGSGRPAASGRTVSQTQAVAQAASGGRTTRAAAPKKTTVAPGGPRIGNAELFADYKDSGALLADYLDSYKKGGSRVWMGKARDELIRRGMTRDQIVAIEQGSKRGGGGGGARGLTGGMTGAYGTGAPQVAHWSQGRVPYASVPGGRTIDAMGRRGQIPQPIRDTYNPYPQKGAPKPPEWNVADLGQLTESILARRLRSIAKRVTPEAMEAGRGWYQRAGEITQGLGAGTGLGRSQIAGATATFSQNAGWSENVRNAQDFFEAFRRGARTVADVERHVATIRKDLSFNALGLEGRTQMALKAAMAETPRGVETAIGGKTGQQSPKVRAFYKALMGDPTSFTVDRHMALMMSGGTIGSKQKMHTPFQKAGQRVAGEMGMSAADLQAVLWTLALGPEHAGADPYGQMRAGGPGGPRGMADPYADWRLREQRGSMREASQTKGLAGDAALSAARDRNIRAEQKRFEDMTPEDIARRNAEIGSILGRGTGGSRPFTGAPGGLGGFGAPSYSRSVSVGAVGAGEFYQPGQERAGVANRTLGIAEDMLAQLRAGATGGTYTAGGERVVTPAQIKRTGRFVTPVGQTSVLPAGVDPRQAARILEAQRAHPENAAVLAAGGVQGFWRNPETGETEVDVNKTFGTRRAAQEELLRNPNQIAAFDLLKGREVGRPKSQPRVTGVGTFAGSRFASDRDYAAAMATPLAAPTTAGEGLDIPTFIRQQGAIQQQAEMPIAAEPGLQEFLENLPAGGGGGGGRRGRPAPGFSGGDDEVGAPRPGGRVAELLNTIEQGKFAVQGARQAGQVRAVGTTVASQLAGLAGRGVDVVRVNEMTSILTKMSKVIETNRAGFDALDKAKDEAADPREIEGLEKALQGPNRELESLTKQFQKLQPNKFAQMATGLAASIGGTIIGLGIFNAVSQGLSVASEALGEVIERQTGYGNIAAKTTGALSDQTRVMHGWVQGAIAVQTGTIGMADSTAKFVDSILEARVAGEASNKNLVEQINLFKTAIAVRQQNAEFGGQDRSLFQTTGGLNIFGVQTPLFGTPSTQELLGRTLGEGSPNIGTTIGPRDISSPARPVGIVDAARAKATDVIPALGPEFKKEAQDYKDAINFINEAMDRGGETAVRFAADVGEITKAEREQAKAQAALAREAGFGDVARAIEDKGGRLRVEGLKGTDRQQIQQLQRGVGAFQQGALLPSKEQAAALTAKQVVAQLDLNQQQGRLQRETLIPGQSFLRQLFAGRAPTGGRVDIQNPLRAGTASLPPEILNRPGIDTSQLSAGLGQVETQANAGRDALVGMIKSADQINQRSGISSNLLDSFNALTKAAGQTAATIRSISQASAWMQVNLQVKQINEQIFLMGRSLEDAKSFLSGAGSGELGLLQNRARSLDIAQAELGFRQQSLSLANQELGITASTLQLQQRQRQINFQRAIAGFVTPGQTPEEIAARQEEARLEANFAQRQQDIGVKQLDNQRESVSLAREQLGISREQFAIQQAMIQVSAERAVGDLGRAIGLLQEQAQVTVQLQVNADAVAAYQEVLEEQKAQIESVIQEAYSVQQTVMSNAAALAAQYGGRITEWNNILIKALSDYVARAGAVLMGFNEQVAGQYASQYGQTGTSSPTGVSGGGARATASGYYGNVSGATQFTVGEAGPETVAIIRNPRSMMWNGGGKGGEGVNINITVTGNNVGSQQDADELAATIARKVEESMSRRSSLLGLRSN